MALGIVNIICAQQTRWHIDKEGNGITWNITQGETHHDHIEMSGRQVSVVLRYGVDKDGAFDLNKSMVWPMLRTIPNNTHASLMRSFDWNPLDGMKVNSRPWSERVESVTLNGTMVVTSRIPAGEKGSLTLKRTYFPAADLPSLIEIYEIVNTGEQDVNVEIPALSATLLTDPQKGVDGSYGIRMLTRDAGTYTLSPGQRHVFCASLSGHRPGAKEETPDAMQELARRTALVDEWTGNLVLDTPEPTLDRMFAFAKIRACESIFQTKGGPLHAPGGESYYAAVWCNDQAEYVNPFFPYVGYDYGNRSALNSFGHFAKYMNDGWKPIPSSIIAEGDGYWNGAGDRGDAAMLAYGASRYALARGDRDEAGRLWPLIEWCLEYNRRKLNPEGVVTSDCDELEGRFPAGEANLCTSSLYYDALLSSAYLAEELKKGSATAKTYRRQAAALKKDIDAYFSSTVEGFETYAYYKGNDVLRSWICIPLTVGINTRAAGTVEALFSPRLWTDNGLLTQAGSQTFWDRSTLYALRGVLLAGEVEKAMEFLRRYSATRLLGDHVPYAVEAWPEGGQRHLSAESGLYARIYTEGLFGIRPTGFRSFSMTPHLPQGWDHMSLRRVRAFGSDFDIYITRDKGETINITVQKGGRTLLDRKAKNGAPLSVTI